LVVAGPVLIAASLAACGGPSAEVGSGEIERAPVGPARTVAYCHNGGATQTMVVWGPATAPDRRLPAVVDVHGGGWVSGDATLALGSLDERVAAAVVAREWVFASINYRLAPASPWPAQIEDAKCAVRFLRAHAASWHIDPHRIGAMGASAGGQLVSLLGLTGPGAGFDEGANLNRSSAVEAVVDEYGPTDLNAVDWSTTPLARQVTPEVFGVPSTLPSAVLAAASPVTYVASGAPPFLVVQGAEDTLVVPDQSRELVHRLQAASDDARLVMVEGAIHGLYPAGARPISPSLPALAQEVVAFFERQLGPGS